MTDKMETNQEEEGNHFEIRPREYGDGIQWQWHQRKRPSEQDHEDTKVRRLEEEIFRGSAQEVVSEVLDDLLGDVVDKATEAHNVVQPILVDGLLSTVVRLSLKKRRLRWQDCATQTSAEPKKKKRKVKKSVFLLGVPDQLNSVSALAGWMEKRGYDEFQCKKKGQMLIITLETEALAAELLDLLRSHPFDKPFLSHLVQCSLEGTVQRNMDPVTTPWMVRLADSALKSEQGPNSLQTIEDDCKSVANQLLEMVGTEPIKAVNIVLRLTEYASRISQDLNAEHDLSNLFIQAFTKVMVAVGWINLGMVEPILDQVRNNLAPGRVEELKNAAHGWLDIRMVCIIRQDNFKDGMAEPMVEEEGIVHNRIDLLMKEGKRTEALKVLKYHAPRMTANVVRYMDIALEEGSVKVTYDVFFKRNKGMRISEKQTLRFIQLVCESNEMKLKTRFRMLFKALQTNWSRLEPLFGGQILDDVAYKMLEHMTSLIKDEDLDEPASGELGAIVFERNGGGIFMACDFSKMEEVDVSHAIVRIFRGVIKDKYQLTDMIEMLSTDAPVAALSVLKYNFEVRDCGKDRRMHDMAWELLTTVGPKHPELSVACSIFCLAPDQTFELAKTVKDLFNSVETEVSRDTFAIPLLQYIVKKRCWEEDIDIEGTLRSWSLNKSHAAFVISNVHANYQEDSEVFFPGDMVNVLNRLAATNEFYAQPENRTCLVSLFSDLFPTDHLATGAIVEMFGWISDTDAYDFCCSAASLVSSEEDFERVEMTFDEASKRFPRLRPMLAAQSIELFKKSPDTYQGMFLKHVGESRKVDVAVKIVEHFKEVQEEKGRFFELARSLLGSEKTKHIGQEIIKGCSTLRSRPIRYMELLEEHASQEDIERLLQEILLELNDGRDVPTLGDIFPGLMETVAKKFEDLRSLISKILLILFADKPDEHIDSLMTFATEEDIEPILDVITEKTIYTSDWGEDLQGIMAVFLTACKERFQGSVPKVFELFLELFEREPIKYLTSLFNYGEEETIGTAISKLMDGMSDRKGTEASKILRKLLSKKSNLTGCIQDKLVSGVAEFLRRPDLDKDMVMEVLQAEAWIERKASFVRCLGEVYKQRELWLLKNNLLLQVGHALVEYACNFRVLQAPVIDFLNMTEREMRLNPLKANEFKENWARHVPLIGCHTGCTGCEILLPFLHNAHQREKNVTVDQTARNCVTRILNRSVQDKEGRARRLADEYGLEYREITADDNQRAHGSRRCGAIVVTKKPTGSAVDFEQRRQVALANMIRYRDFLVAHSKRTGGTQQMVPSQPSPSQSPRRPGPSNRDVKEEDGANKDVVVIELE